MEIETKYQLAKLDPPEVVETPDVVASEVVADVPNQVEQVVEPVVVEQILDPIPEEPTVKKRGRKKKVVQQVEGEVVAKQKRIRKPKIVEKVDGETNGEEVVKKKRVRKPKAVIEQGQGEEVVGKKGPGRPRKPKIDTRRI